MTLLLPTALFFPLLSLLFFFLLFLLSHRTSSDKGTRQLPPGPRPWPIVGSVLGLMRSKSVIRWILRMVEGEPIACIRIGSTHIVVVSSPEIANQFLKKHDAAFTSRPITMASECASRGYRSTALSPQGEQWKKMRRALGSEVLNARRFRWQLDLRREEADHIVRYVKHCCETAGGKVVADVRFITRTYTGNLIRRMLFNRRHFGGEGVGGGPAEAEIKYVNAAFDVLSMLYAFAVSDYFPRMRWFDLEGHEKIVKAAAETINRYHDSIIDERVQGWRCDYSEKLAAREPEDLLDVMICMKDSDGKALLTVEEIKAQCAELVYATVDNGATISEWAIGEMMKEPKIFAKAVEELDRVVGRDRLVQESDFPELPYVKACAREALRLHPVVPFNLPHVSTEDATVAGYFIPKGSHVLLSRVGLGRNPEVWKDPLRYDPDRHLSREDSERVGGDVELAEPGLRFISFTAGRRGCMGALVGSAMSYMLLARLLQCFEWSAPPGGFSLEECDDSLYMKTPLHATVSPRLPALLDQL